MRNLKKSIKRRWDKASTQLCKLIYGHLKPSAMIIGAQKSGTTAMYKYLSQHPDIIPPKIKELHFFNCDRFFSQGYRKYVEFFPIKTPSTKNKITLDVTPGYFFSSEKTAKRIFEFNPDLRLILILRDPVYRAFSAWQMYRKYYTKDSEWFFKWHEERNFGDPYQNYVKRLEYGRSFMDDLQFEVEQSKMGKVAEMSVLGYGLYSEQLKNFYRYFEKNKIIILTNEDLRKDVSLLLSKVEKHIEIQEFDWEKADTSPHFEGNYKDEMTIEEVNFLRDYYRGSNKDLREITGLDFNWIC